MEFGLSRIHRLLHHFTFPWKAIHVAGTNGKGSVCAYASAMLHAANLRCGRFTSPHLVDRWDSITIDGATVSPALFHDVEAYFRAKSKREDIGASDFEILTAIAFEIFNREHIDIGVVEAGLGGSYDATNVLPNTVASVITKVGFDHQVQLGSSIESIATHKAGIMRQHTPCLVDSTNDTVVLNVIRHLANTRGATLVPVPQHGSKILKELSDFLIQSDYLPFQIMNIQLAFQAAEVALASLEKAVTTIVLFDAIRATGWPGRLEFLDLSRLVPRKEVVLLDGAHNPQASATLRTFVDMRLSRRESSVTWLVAISDNKNVHAMLQAILRPGDILIATDFPPVEGMPWVTPMDPMDIMNIANSVCALDPASVALRNSLDALHVCAILSKNRHMVVTGSLYLIGHIHRLQRSLQSETHIRLRK